MEILGIQFAPFLVPFSRRLQSLAAATWFLTLAFGGFFSWGLTAYILLCRGGLVWWSTVLYILWIYFVDIDAGEIGGRPCSWVQNWSLWKYMIDYFPIKLERVPWVELDPKKNYLFCYFPHGILPAGNFGSFATDYGGFRELFPRHEARVMILSQHFVTPFFREFCLSVRGVSASAKSIGYLLGYPGGGRVGVLTVGGAAESYYCKPGQYRIVLKKRKGFVRLALKHGTPLVPVWSFGETDLFDQVGEEGSTFRKFQEVVRRWIGFAPIVVVGRGFFQYSFGLMPRRKPVTTVVGTPVEVPKIEEPTKEQIDEYHQKFTERLIQMFEEQKYNYLENPEQTKLVVT